MVTTPPRWDLDPLFASVDSREFTAAVELVYADVERLAALYDERGVRGGEPTPPTAADGETIDAIIDATNRLHERMRVISAYLNALVTTDSRDERAASLLAELQTRAAPLGPLAKRLEAWIADKSADGLAQLSETAAAHRFALARAEVGSGFQMSEPEESLASQLSPSGAIAWQRLHGDVSSQLDVTIVNADGTTEVVPMTMARGRATDADRARREAAYRGELAAWSSAAVPLAAALNGAKGEYGVLNRRRGYTDDLQPALHANAIERSTLDAMTAAVEAVLPDFRRYLRAKARVLGSGERLPWWDLFAPMGRAESVPWEQAERMVADAFGAYGPSLAALAQRAFGERWVDAEMRDGKRGGAYCMGVGGDVSRVMMNFDGSNDSVSTLAHELGHAYHNVALAPRTMIQRRLPMALAETASIFCETLFFRAQLDNATTDAGRLSLLDTHLTGATQIVVDIHSRYLFEWELCRRRARTTVPASDLCSMMLDAQAAAYGDGLDPSARHPYMWAVKGHYFTPFYNWPYTFGLLFGIGLYTRYCDDADVFRSGYDDLLSSTGMADAKTLAAGFGIDIDDRAFWDSSLAVLVERIDTYETLAAS